MAFPALVQPRLALRGWTTVVVQKMVELMTVELATVGPRTIVSGIGGRTDDGMSTSTGAVCDKSVTISNPPVWAVFQKTIARSVGSSRGNCRSRSSQLYST